MKRQAPDRIGDLGGGTFKGSGHCPAIGEIGRKIRPDSHPRRAGQRGHRDNEIGALFRRKGKRIGQHKAALGIGIVDLDGQAIARGQNIAGAKGIAGHGVFDRRDEHAQLNRQPKRHDHMRKPQNCRGPAHILFHQPHA